MISSPATLTDAEFDALWESRVEEAARTGDEIHLEEIMLAHGEAFAERYADAGAPA